MDNLHPYIEPLIRHFQSDTELKKHFTENDFFRPISEVDIGIDALLDKGDNCLDIKSIWIAPQNSTALNQNSCNFGRVHNFQIMINIPCGTGPFYWEKTDDNSVRLSGSFMILSHYMRDVLKSVNSFNSQDNIESDFFYDDIIFVGDKIVHPAQNKNFMTGILDFKLTIY